ncbi:MAG: hypothetical protein ACYC7E_19715 [Armatimonadota bacterium]
MRFRLLCLSVFLLASACLAGPLTITRVWPEQLCYKPGATARILVDVANAGPQATAKVSLAIRYSLDGYDLLPAQTANLAANGKATLAFSYPISKNRKWGHDALATLAGEDGKVQSTGRDCFTVGSNPWELGHYVTIFGLRDRCPSMKDIENYVIKTRKAYYTTFEAYAPYPSYSDGMAPDTEIWRSAGDSYNRESKTHWRELVRQSHNNGMAVVTYIQCTSSGPVGSDFVRRHPEWWAYNKEGRLPVQIIEVDQLTAAREAPEEQSVGIRFGGYYHTTLGILPSQAHLGDWWINQVIKSTEMFGWDGFRSDGTPGFTSGYDINGKLHELKDLSAVNAEFSRKIKTKLTARFPDFHFGWNWVVFTPDGQHTDQKQSDAVIPGSYMLWEAFNGAPKPGSVLHNWRRMARDLRREAAYVRERGGFPHAGWMPSNKYLEAVASACGVHIDTWSNPEPYRRFEFRWGEFIWDNALRYVRPGDSAVTVTAPPAVWWQDFVQTCDLPGGGKRVVVHLLNMPAKDDDAWADRPPAPAENVQVTVEVPAGMVARKKIAISPDYNGDVIELPAFAELATNTVNAGQVKLWTMVVVDMEAKR